MDGLAMNVWTPRGEAEKRPQRVAIDNNSIIARQRRSCPSQPGQSRRGGVTNSNEAERLQWVALTVLGLVAGLALALPLGVPIFAIVGAMAGTPIVLGIVYFMVLTPIGVVRRAAGGNPLAHKLFGDGYWIARPPVAPKERRSRMERQF